MGDGFGLLKKDEKWGKKGSHRCKEWACSIVAKKKEGNYMVPPLHQRVGPPGGELAKGGETLRGGEARER